MTDKKTTIICTVGTSTLEKTKTEYLPWNSQIPNDVSNPNHIILDNMCREYTVQKLYGQSFNSFAAFELTISTPIETLIDKYLKVIRGDWNADTWRLMPAEVASTLRIVEGLQVLRSNCRVILIVSDTGHSYVAAKVVQAMLEELGFSVPDEAVEIIEGFQMENIDTFMNEGLPNFIESIKKYMNNGEDDEEEIHLFNITGGYKNFIPIVTHIASFFRKDMYYVFEEAVGSGKNSLVKIPNIPTFNSLLAETSGNVVLEFIDEIQKKEFDNFIDMNRYIYKYYSDGPVGPFKDFISKFFELKNNKVELSIIGSIYLELIKAQCKG